MAFEGRTTEYYKFTGQERDDKTGLWQAGH
jgi:hypothetical protein